MSFGGFGQVDTWGGDFFIPTTLGLSRKTNSVHQLGV